MRKMRIRIFRMGVVKKNSRADDSKYQWHIHIQRLMHV
jgi:hypothetical protein